MITQDQIDAARYRKLRGWMSGNVPETWKEVENMGAVAAWASWDEMDAYLDALPDCTHGLMSPPHPYAPVVWASWDAGDSSLPGLMSPSDFNIDAVDRRIMEAKRDTDAYLESTALENLLKDPGAFILVEEQPHGYDVDPDDRLY